MSYRMTVPENSVGGQDKYVNASGTQCVAFVQQVTRAPSTARWRQGIKVADAQPGQILHGTAIATFDANGHYPTDALGKHAAIYLSHNAQAIRVLDQWEAQHEVRPRSIRFGQPRGTRRSNDANTFYVIE